MDLLGPSLHDLNYHHKKAARAAAGAAGAPRRPLPRLGAYARGMLGALEGLHSQGLIHHDVKPANFLVAPPSGSSDGGSNGAAGAGEAALQQEEEEEEPQVFLIDFGFALRWVGGQGELQQSMIASMAD